MLHTVFYEYSSSAEVSLPNNKIYDLRFIKHIDMKSFLKRKSIWQGYFFLLFFTITGINNSIIYAQARTGSILPLWSEGYLDIHHINTGKGECVFCIFPDGTTMLVDAGATTRPKPRVTDPRPDDSRSPGEWITRYIKHMMSNMNNKRLNYVVLTHFHGDHIGDISSNMKKFKNSEYILSGISEVCSNIPFDKIIDRGWPNYNYPETLKSANILNYIKFVKWQKENNGIIAERFIAGSNDQIKMLFSPEKYPSFEIRNIAVNGQVWNGHNNNCRNCFPPLSSLSPSEYPSENMCSLAFRLSYGNFDYYNGGDMCTSDDGWRDIESVVGFATGPVEVCEANHHAYIDGMGKKFLSFTRPKVMIIQLWSPGQPAVTSLSRMLSTYPGPRDIFSTNLMEETKVVIGDNLEKLKSQQGHIVIRVNPNGENFMIYILDDSKESFIINSIHGPYQCE